MRYEIVLAPEAIQDFKRLRPEMRAVLRKAIDLHLRNEPTKSSRSRIKRLRGLTRPQYRLRVGEVRVFYDIDGRLVLILAIVLKANAARWLEEAGKRL